jgi:hypothetical protein
MQSILRRDPTAMQTAKTETPRSERGVFICLIWF